MEQRLVVEISRLDSLPCMQIHLKLPERYGGDALSYSEVWHENR
jgi:hypothetical protein